MKLRTFLLILVNVIVLTAYSGNPNPHYSYENDNIFWFIQISDTHIGDEIVGGDQDTTFLNEVTSRGYSAFEPAFIVATGDLTDATNGGLIPMGQFDEEWQTYNEILINNGMNPQIYYDLPGNHDHYSEQDFHHYLTYSIQGPYQGSTQFSWNLEYPFGTYHFVAVCTPSNDGLPWPYDFAGLDYEELEFLVNDLEEYKNANLTFIFGHHPIYDWFYGSETFQDICDYYKVSVYAYGHIHRYECNFIGQTPTMHISVASLGKSTQDHILIYAIDNDAVSYALTNVKKNAETSEVYIEFPVVILTAPQPLEYCTNNIQRYPIPRSNTENPIRALVFDYDMSNIAYVKYKIDDGNYEEMSPVDDGLHIWEAYWDSTPYDYGEHTIYLRVRGTTTVEKEYTIELSETQCSDGIDNDNDNFVDLEDPGCQDLLDNDESEPGRFLNLSLYLNKNVFRAGDRFLLRMDIDNPQDNSFNCNAFVALEAFGNFYFYPSWKKSFDYINLNIEKKSSYSQVILDFYWPSNIGSASGLKFHALLIDPDTQTALSDLVTVQFSYY